MLSAVRDLIPGRMLGGKREGNTRMEVRKASVFASTFFSYIPSFLSSSFSGHSKNNACHSSSNVPPSTLGPDDKASPGAAYTYLANCHTFSFSVGFVVRKEKLHVRTYYISYTRVFFMESRCVRRKLGFNV